MIIHCKHSQGTSNGVVSFRYRALVIKGPFTQVLHPGIFVSSLDKSYIDGCQKSLVADRKLVTHR